MKKTSKKKTAAKAPRAKGGVLLERTDKVILRDKDSVLKIFGTLSAPWPAQFVYDERLSSI